MHRQRHPCWWTPGGPITGEQVVPAPGETHGGFKGSAQRLDELTIFVLELVEEGRTRGDEHVAARAASRRTGDMEPVCRSVVAGRARGDPRRTRAGRHVHVIDVNIGRVVSTVSREVNDGGGRDAHRAHVAHQAASEHTRRPKTPKLACPRLAAKVAEGLVPWGRPSKSPTGYGSEFPHDPMMWVSHATIYLSLFVEGRGQLRREHCRCLRTGPTPAA